MMWALRLTAALAPTLTLPRKAGEGIEVELSLNSLLRLAGEGQGGGFPIT